MIITPLTPGTLVHITTHRPGFHQLTHEGEYVATGFERIDRGQNDRHIDLVDSHKQYMRLRRYVAGRAIHQSIPVENIIDITVL